jgi:SEC-C motif-containing protein
MVTWHPSTRPSKIAIDPLLQWTHVEIVFAAGGPFDREGTVEFRAHYGSAAGRGELHERSRFVREGSTWLYLDGDVGPLV